MQVNFTSLHLIPTLQIPEFLETFGILELLEIHEFLDKLESIKSIQTKSSSESFWKDSKAFGGIRKRKNSTN